MKRRIIALITSLTLIILCSASVMANENDKNDIVKWESKASTITMPSQDSTSKEINQAILKDIKDTNYIDYESSLETKNGKVIIPKKELLVKKLLKHYKKNPEKQKENINNVDKFADEIISYYTKVNNNEISAQDFRLYPHTHYWSTGPSQTNHYHEISYATSWVGIDCYRSSVGGSKGTSESISITTTLGFSGSALIKEVLNIGGSWSYSHNTTTTVSASTNCPAWTVQWWRPYCRYEVTDYAGCYVTEYYDINGNLVSEGRGEYSTNKVLKDDMTEFADKVNTLKNPNASTPTPPTGVPNAWW